MTTTKIDQHFTNWVAQQRFQPAKQKALLAACELFSAQGYAATSTAQIAKTADIGEGTIFKYFKNKAGLLQAVLEPITSTLIPSLQQDVLDQLQLQKYPSSLAFCQALMANRLQLLHQNWYLMSLVLDQLLVNPTHRKQLQQIATKGGGQALMTEFNQLLAHYFPTNITYQTILLEASRLLFGEYFKLMTVNRDNFDWETESQKLGAQLNTYLTM